MASVIFMPHPGTCRDCARYAGQLGAAVEDLRQWATRALIVVSDEDSMASARTSSASAAYLLDDRRGDGRAQLGVGDDQAAVVQADRWGAVYEVAAVGPESDHDAALPTAADLVALAQFIDIQCPECGVPSKEWLGASPFPLG